MKFKLSMEKDQIGRVNNEEIIITKNEWQVV